MVDGNEEKILKRAIKGEASAFGLLYNKYQPQIYRFIYFKVGHREEAEDLCHQVFLSAWQNIRSYKIQKTPFFSNYFSAWLYSISRNKIIDYYRNFRNKKIFSEINEVEIIIEENFSDQIDKKINNQKIQKAILQLSEIEQDVLIMKFIEDLSSKEIAKNLKKNEVLIRVTQHRAIKKLRDILENKKSNGKF